jgi:hypothetical protein
LERRHRLALVVVDFGRGGRSLLKQSRPAVQFVQFLCGDRIFSCRIAFACDFDPRLIVEDEHHGFEIADLAFDLRKETAERRRAPPADRVLKFRRPNWAAADIGADGGVLTVAQP